ncbi:MAG: hypothetical protein J6P45_02765, partial [Lachnospiraceae bacterium]|nr:hypothetical protein [Lachnospiraceae bacterium]
KDDKAALTLNTAAIEYGESATSGEASAQVDKLLKISLQASGNTISTDHYTVYYKYTTSADEVKSVSSNADFTGITSKVGNLQSFNAGKTVYVVAEARYEKNTDRNVEAENAVAWAVLPVTISPRKIKLTSSKSMTTKRGKALSANDLSSNKVDDVTASLYDSGANYAGSPNLPATTMLSANAVENGVGYRIDDSGVDYDIPGTYTVAIKKGSYGLQTAYKDNFEVVETKATINVEAVYYATFYIEYNGSSSAVSQCEINSSGNLTGWNNAYTTSFNGFIPEGATLSWYVGSNTSSSSITNGMYLGGNDVVITGLVTISVTGGGTVKATSIRPVTYDGRSHFLSRDGGKKENVSNIKDLVLTITDTEKNYKLVLGKDYTVKYLNNKNASVKYDSATGKYEPLYTADKKRPQVIVTGKGDYKGMALTAYYNILPMNLYDYDGTGTQYFRGVYDATYNTSRQGIYYYDADINGLNTAYKADKNGKVKLNYKVLQDKYWYTTKNNYKTLTLKKGEKKDYVEQLYKYTTDEGGNGYWEKVSAVAGAGSYMLTVTGVNNYTGTIPSYFVAKGSTTSNVDYFTAGSSEGQFKVISANVLEMSKAKVKLKKPVPAYTEGKSVSANAFIESVTIGKTTVNKDWYTAYIYQDAKGATLDTTGDNGDGTDTTNAGTMYIQLVANNKALENNIFGSSKFIKVQVSGGVKLNKNQFKLEVSENGKYTAAPAKRDYNGKATIIAVSGDKLTPGKDYQVNGWPLGSHTRYHNAPQDANKYTYTITGKGKYIGTVKLTYTINKANLKKVFNQTVISASAVAADGANINGTPTNIIVSQNGVATTLNNVTTYDDAYRLRFTLSNHTKAGEATVTVKPLNSNSNYSGSVKFNYTIAPKKITTVSDLAAAQKANSIVAGALYATLEDVQYKENGTFDPKLKLYQADAAGSITTKVLKNKTDYIATPTHQASANTVTLTNGSKGSYDFGDKGVKIDPTFNTYLNKVSKVVLTVSNAYVASNGETYKMDVCDNTKQKYEATYTGLGVEPEVTEITVYSGQTSKTYKAASGNFAVSYLNNTNAGKKAQIVINLKSSTGKDQYDIGGSKAIMFTINPQKEKSTVLSKSF